MHQDIRNTALYEEASQLIDNLRQPGSEISCGSKLYPELSCLPDAE